MTKFTIAEARDYACRRIFGAGFVPISAHNNNKFQQEKVDAQYLYAERRLEAQGIILGDMRSGVACISQAELDTALNHETGIARAAGARGPEAAVTNRLVSAMLSDLRTGTTSPDKLRGEKQDVLVKIYGATRRTAVIARERALREFATVLEPPNPNNQ